MENVDLLGVDALALVGEGGVARDDEAIADARQIGGEVFGDAVGEIVLGRIGREICERQHDEREMCGLRRFRRSSIEDVPAASGDQKEKGGDGGRERGEGRARFARQRLTPIGWWRRSGLTRRADLQRVGSHWLGDVLQRHGAEIADLQIEPPLHLTIGVVGDANPSGLGDPLQARGDIDAIAHQVAVALFDHVAEMDANPKFDALVRRDPSIALDHRPLDFNGAVHRVDDAAELDDAAVARALDYAPVMHSDGRIDQVASERPQPRQNPVLVGSGKPR